MALGETGELPADSLVDRRRCDEVLRAGVHIAEQTLDRPGTQAQRPGGLIDELRNLVGGRRHIDHRRPNQGLLPERQGLVAIEVRIAGAVVNAVDRSAMHMMRLNNPLEPQ